MIKINYQNYLKKKDFDFESEYKKIFTSNFGIYTKSKPRKEFKYNNGKAIFKDKKQVSLADVFSTFKDNKIEEFDSIFDEKLLNDIFILDTLSILEFIHKNGNKSSSQKLKYFFNYEKFQSEITEFFTKNFEFTTCFYCNKDFITNFNTTKKVSTFQLDHFYDKGKYPYLALSFYNLIPSCPTCNSSKVKGSANCYAQCKIPNSNDFNFDEKIKFKLFLSNECKNLHIKDKESIEIPLKENYSDEYAKYIKVFKLNERYKAHKDIVFEMIEKAEQYPESRLRELENLTGIPYQEIKKDIFNLINEDDDLSKKPFSKLIKDISEELELI
ncbi:MAG: hypothetical protein WC691_05455 [Sulfuricurvum sp.]|jgi:hypothetical protein